MTPYRTRRLVNAGLWLAALFSATLFMLAALAHLSSSMSAQFVAWGYTANFALGIGVLQFIGALGLLLPRTAGWSALGLSVIMLGAIGTHVAHGEHLLAIVPLALLSVLGFVLWGRGLVMEPTTRGHVVATKNPIHPTA